MANTRVALASKAGWAASAVNGAPASVVDVTAHGGGIRANGKTSAVVRERVAAVGGSAVPALERDGRAVLARGLQRSACGAARWTRGRGGRA